MSFKLHIRVKAMAARHINTFFIIIYFINILFYISLPSIVSLRFIYLIFIAIQQTTPPRATNKPENVTKWVCTIPFFVILILIHYI
jgi:hypothetical protein